MPKVPTFQVWNLKQLKLVRTRWMFVVPTIFASPNPNRANKKNG
ncbi:hypothetical protein AMTRI_Chr04g252940 [Amborella trichopoda]